MKPLEEGMYFFDNDGDLSIIEEFDDNLFVYNYINTPKDLSKSELKEWVKNNVYKMTYADNEIEEYRHLAEEYFKDDTYTMIDYLNSKSLKQLLENSK